ncbi:enoyl-CoA hydratase/isomerase family protein [Frankia gtarii]|uniref:enoyl-CoA hydratase/isomerase family protein n=1 Tax=Frankia gtarii TaxID=2950102 RepID=UPI0021C05BF3|nr:enoyl-CoA hydratase-related protein [Frankia gtarii]
MTGQPGSVLELDRSDGVLTVILNRPQRLNALDSALVEALAAAWSEAADPDIRAVIITGAGRGFCAGADLRADRPKTKRPTGLRVRFNPHVLALASLRKPVIAAVNGVAAGAGLALACAADIRIASTEARFVPAFASVGVTPDAGASYFVPRLVGASRAFEWFATGRHLDASAAQEWGLVSEIVEPSRLLPVARERALLLAAVPGEALALTKALLQRSLTATLPEQLESEVESQLAAIAAPGREEARAAVVSRIRGGPDGGAPDGGAPEGDRPARDVEGRHD